MVLSMCRALRARRSRELTAQDGLAHDLVVPRAHEGGDGQALARRGLDDGHVARAGHAQVEGARDGRGGEGEHVDQLAELLEALLVLEPQQCTASSPPPPDAFVQSAYVNTDLT